MLSTHVPRSSPFSSSVFHTASALSAPSGHLPLEGKALSVVILFPHMRVFTLTMREKRHSRIAALPIEEGGPRSGARVLVYRLLETISPLFFIPLVPYPPLRGTFPTRGRLCIRDSGTLVYDALETIFALVNKNWTRN